MFNLTIDQQRYIIENYANATSTNIALHLHLDTSIVRDYICCIQRGLKQEINKLYMADKSKAIELQDKYDKFFSKQRH